MTDEVTPPSNIAFERMILGAALTSPDGLDLAMQRMKASDFWVADHRLVFEALVGHVADGHVVEVPLLARALSRSENPTSANAFVLLGQLATEACTLAVLPEVIADVVACSNARALAEMGRNLVQRAYGTQGDQGRVADAFAETDTDFRALTELVVPEDWSTIYSLASKVRDPEHPTRLIPTGFLDIDRVLGGGLREGQVIIVAGRPGFGKTTLTMDVARHAAIRCDVPTLFVSLEMSGPELAARLMSAEAGVPLAAVRAAEPMTDEDETYLLESLDRIEDAPLYVADSLPPTLPNVRNAIVSMVRRRGVRLVVIDFIQLVQDHENNPSREQVVSKFAVELKNIAKAEEIAVVIAAQLNRGPEQRADKRPMLSDLRESGSLEQAADVALLIFRPEQYVPTERPGEADIEIAKHRNGPTATVTLAFQGHYSRFASLAHAADPSSGS